MEKLRIPKQRGKFCSPQITEYLILLRGNILFWALILPSAKHPFCSCGKKQLRWFTTSSEAFRNGTQTSHILKWRWPNTKIESFFFFSSPDSHILCCSFMPSSFSGFVTDFVLLKLLTAMWECLKQFDSAIFYGLHLHKVVKTWFSSAIGQTS